MAATLHLEIVTPTRTAFAGTVDEVTVPGSEGELGILPGHLALMATVDAGSVVAGSGQGRREFAVGFGFVEVAADRVRLLVDSCDGVDDIDVDRARTMLADLEGKLDRDEFKTRDELDEATAEAARARARVALIERATGKR